LNAPDQLDRRDIGQCPVQLPEFTRAAPADFFVVVEYHIATDQVAPKAMQVDAARFQICCEQTQFVANLNLQSKFLPDFPGQCLLWSFAWLQLASSELSLQSRRATCFPSGSQDTAFMLNHRGDNQDFFYIQFGGHVSTKAARQSGGSYEF
jgi:hypothetical protein